MDVFNNVLELIGNTPVVRINHMDTGPCELFIKLESQNPGASIKDRIGLRMIEDAEQAGLIRPGFTKRLSSGARDTGQDEPGKDFEPESHGR
jgi:cystathionine beta-synthase